MVTTSSRERRRSLRVEVHGQIHAEVLSLSGTSVVVCNLSREGVAIECSLLFLVGNVEALRFRTPTEADLGEFRAEVVSSRRVSVEPPRFVTGLAFVDPDTQDIRTRLDVLFDAAMASRP